MQRIAWIASVVVAMALGSWGTVLLGHNNNSEPLPPPLSTLEKMGHLVSAKVNVADIIEITKYRNFGIPWPAWHFNYAGTKVLLIVRGDCSLATDLRTPKYESIDKVKHAVTIILPAPSVLQPRVNHGQGGTQIYSVSNLGIAAIIPGNTDLADAINQAMSLAQQKVEQAGKSPDVIRVAKENAELVLKSLYYALGWNASIRWT